MGKTGSSIRRGFEYQDLVCAHKLLDLIERGQLTTAFSIESDEVNFADDLIIFPPKGQCAAHQIKSHVLRSYVDSFDTLTDKKTPRSRSLLQKLYDGWRKLSDSGESLCDLNFISSAQADVSENGLASAINTADDKFGQHFFTEAAFASVRAKWCKDLGIQESQLKEFLNCVKWQFGYISHSRLRAEVIDQLRRLKLPVHNAAFVELIEVDPKNWTVQ